MLGFKFVPDNRNLVRDARSLGLIDLNVIDFSVNRDNHGMDLAEWFVSTEYPLTARVAVNQFWQRLFGVGIVKTSEDFGTRGDWPSHPDLLDYLAVSFIESGWDVKALTKQIVRSETYKQASKATPERFENDPENRLFSRGPRFRMDSEMIRDQVLATSGLLNYDLYGRSVNCCGNHSSNECLPKSWLRLWQRRMDI